MPVSQEYVLAKFGFDTAENEPCKVCRLYAYSSLRYEAERLDKQLAEDVRAACCISRDGSSRMDPDPEP